MSGKEVETFWLDMGAPISLLSRVVAPVAHHRIARSVNLLLADEATAEDPDAAMTAAWYAVRVAPRR
jgi:hypothetical protein